VDPGSLYTAPTPREQFPLPLQKIQRNAIPDVWSLKIGRVSAGGNRDELGMRNLSRDVHISP
jgi:hypothetical protein